MQDWVIFILGLLLAIPISILANMVTPNIKSYIEKKSLTKRERELYVLFSDYKYIKALRYQPNAFNIVMFRRLSLAITVLTLLVAIVGSLILFSTSETLPNMDYIAYLAIIVLLVLTYWAFLDMKKTNLDMTHVLYFEEYREKVITRVIELGGNPEDLDEDLVADKKAVRKKKLAE